MAILRARELTVGYNGTPVLKNINTILEPGSFTTLIGSNGAGKSTLLRTLTGLLKPLSGEVLINDQDISFLSRRRLARLVSMVSTERNGGDDFTVRETVALGRIPHSSLFDNLSGKHSEIINNSVKAVGLTELLNRNVSSLSDGERQKVMIATSLAQESPLMILDEPTSFLDVAARIEILHLLRNLAEKDRAIILSTHDLPLAIALSTHLWVVDPMEKTLIAGERDDIIRCGAVEKAFPGKNLHFNPDTYELF